MKQGFIEPGMGKTKLSVQLTRLCQSKREDIGKQVERKIHEKMTERRTEEDEETED